MNTNDIKIKKAALLKSSNQRLENIWSGFSQAIEEAEEFIYDIRETDKYDWLTFEEKEELEIFYEDYVDNLKFQAEGLQAESQQAIDKFKQKFNIEEEV